MAVVPYYDQTKVKVDLRIPDTSQDTQLDHWGEEAENEIDDMLYSTASKMRRIASLPVLPFASGSVPESVQGAADHYVQSKYYEFVRNVELADHHDKKWKERVENFVSRLKTEKRIYTRIVR